MREFIKSHNTQIFKLNLHNTARKLAVSSIIRTTFLRNKWNRNRNREKKPPSDLIILHRPTVNTRASIIHPAGINPLTKQSPAEYASGNLANVRAHSANSEKSSYKTSSLALARALAFRAKSTEAKKLIRLSRAGSQSARACVRSLYSALPWKTITGPPGRGIKLFSRETSRRSESNYAYIRLLARATGALNPRAARVSLILTRHFSLSLHQRPENRV